MPLAEIRLPRRRSNVSSKPSTTGPARELDLQPDLLLLRRHPRSLLRSVEQAHRSALAHHVHRPAGLGSPVLIMGAWYKPVPWPRAREVSSFESMQNRGVLISSSLAILPVGVGAISLGWRS